MSAIVVPACGVRELANGVLTAAECELLETLRDPVVVVDETGCIAFASTQTAVMFGYRPDELLGRPPELLLPEAERDRHRLERQRVLERPRSRPMAPPLALHGRRADGFEFPVDISLSLLERSGRRLLVATIRDMSERAGLRTEMREREHRADEERRRLEGLLQQASKMEAIGRLAGGVAHDFNNILTVIRGYAESALARTEAGSDLWHDVDQIEQAAARASDLTRQLLAFSRQQAIAPQALALDRRLGDMEGMLRRTVGADVIMTIASAEGLWPVLSDPPQIDQLVMNLVVNARDAMPAGGRLTIDTGNVTIDANEVAGHPGASPGDYVALTITDSGVGMDEATRAHMFEPFFTTKGAGRGTGLGLATIYGIVQQHRGFIDVASEPGRGTSIRVCLPRHTGEWPATPSAPASRVAGGSETVLLVEDDEAVRILTSKMLQRLGYEVIEAAGPEQALETAAHVGDRIDLLLTDVVMPVMNGAALADRASAVLHDARVLFMSGHPSAILSENSLLPPDIHFVQKPFDQQALGRAVRTALDTEPQRPAPGGPTT